MIAPTSSDYAEAIQNPQVTLSDPRLRRAVPAQTPYGPRVYSGGFAAVFELHETTTKWAVRCFTHETSGLRDRYLALAAFLQRVPAPFFVPVEFIDQGIRVGPTKWPILLMPWVDGRALNDAVRESLTKPNELHSLRARFITLATALERLGVAHGDLQHGNILVRKDGALALVDYDGMFLPEFAGQAATERGHPNYQHPARTSTEFGPHLDRFSVAVIVTALEALEADPRLWETFDNGENLLFRAQDFAGPTGSELLAALARAGLGHLAERMVRLVELRPAEIPAISQVLVGAIPRPSAPQARATPSGPVTPYQVVDLRLPNASQFVGERVIIVGEVVSTRRDITNRGDPYLFLNLAGPGGDEVKVVVWSEVLARLRADVATSRGQVASAVGVLTRYQGRLQIQLERAPLFAVLSTTDAERLLGSAWSGPPPARRRLTHPRIGDLIGHSTFGRGRVDAVSGDIVTVTFPAGQKRIQFTKFFLELLEAGPVQRTQAPGGRASRSRPAAPIVHQPVAPHRPAVPPTPASRVSTGQSAPISRSAANNLNSLFGAATSNAQPVRPSPSVTTKSRAPQSPRTKTPNDPGLGAIWVIVTAIAIATIGVGLNIPGGLVLLAMVVGAFLVRRRVA